MKNLLRKTSNPFQGIFEFKGAHLFLLFVASIFLFAAYYSFVIPKHFLYASDVLKQDIAIKEERLSREIRSVVREGIRQYAKNFIFRMADGAEEYSYSFTSAESGETLHLRVIPDMVQVLNASVNDGIITFDVRLPPIHEALNEVQIRQPIHCNTVISSVRITDNQNDLIHCHSSGSEQVKTLTQYDLFYPQAPNGIEPAQVVFEHLADVMPLARQLSLNKNGLYGAELEQFSSMVLLSTAIITTTGTLGIEPVTHHARLMVALQSVWGIFIFLWYLGSVVRKKSTSAAKG